LRRKVDDDSGLDYNDIGTALLPGFWLPPLRGST